MIDQHELKIEQSGSKFTIGTIKGGHKDLSYLNNDAQVCLFDGLDTLLDYVTTNMVEPKRSGSSAQEGSGGFNAFATYDEAVNTFRKQPEKVVHFDPAELRIKDDSEAGNTVDYDVVGDYIDMGRFMEGIPEAWGSMHNGNARNRRVNIILAVGQTWDVRHEDITHRGERVLRLVDALEAGGVRTQIVGIASNECGHIEVTIKRHDEPLTLTDLAVISHPEFLRRVVFRINEYSKTWDYGYGSSIKFSRAIEDKPEMLASDSNDEMNIFVDSNIRGINNIDFVFDQLEKLLQWEMSKPVPEVDAVKVASHGIYFNPNGARDDDEVQREGQAAINAD